MGRYLSSSWCSSSVNKTLRSYCKIRYLMILLRTCPRLAKGPLRLGIHGNSLPSSPHPARLTKKTSMKHLHRSGSTCSSSHSLKDYTREVTHYQLVRFCSSSSRDTFKAGAPIGIMEEPKNSFDLSSVGGHLGQSFSQLSRHINIYFRRKDVAPHHLSVTALDHVGRSQRRSQTHRAAREQKLTEDKDKQEISRTRPSTKTNSGLQLFHMSSLATTFGESYSYVAHHINSVFSRGFAKVPVTFPRRTHRMQKRRKMENTDVKKEAERSVNLEDDQEAVKPNNVSSGWEEGYLHFARHINKYFGAKVTDDHTRHRREQLPFPSHSTSQTSGVVSQSKQEEPSSAETRGLFHSSRDATNFGENHFQMANHINQYFKGQNGLDEDTNLLVEKDLGSAASEKALSFMDCLRHPTSAIPGLLGAYLKLGPLTQTGKPRPAIMSAETVLSKKVSSVTSHRNVPRNKEIHLEPHNVSLISFSKPAKHRQSNVTKSEV